MDDARGSWPGPTKLTKFMEVTMEYQRLVEEDPADRLARLLPSLPVQQPASSMGSVGTVLDEVIATSAIMGGYRPTGPPSCTGGTWGQRSQTRVSIWLYRTVRSYSFPNHPTNVLSIDKRPCSSLQSLELYGL
jgi:hypothetical protein